MVGAVVISSEMTNSKVLNCCNRTQPQLQSYTKAYVHLAFNGYCRHTVEYMLFAVSSETHEETW